ncbi:MAG: hypothetical protein JW940_04100 [Polyangiaceae bacterium]|nr:hypothetical protein [Polyangiaceae bacterium]
MTPEREKRRTLAAAEEGPTSDELWSADVLFLGEYTHLLDSTRTQGTGNIYAARFDVGFAGMPGAPAFALGLESALGGASDGLFYDLKASLGCGGWFNRWLGLGALIGLGLSEVTGGVMPHAQEAPTANGWLGLNLGSSLRVEARARASWLFVTWNDGDRKRYTQKPSTVPPERYVGGHVLFGKRPPVSVTSHLGTVIALGLAYWETMGTQAVIAQAGMGFAAGP